MITTEWSVVQGVIGSPLILSCTSEGSPPDTFTWMKDGTPIAQSTSITTVTHTSAAAEFQTNYTINNFDIDYVGTYTCIVNNPIGNDSSSIEVLLNGTYN